nr:immunoglobulin heavy chain junction region [Macaca mulatta]MOX58990.1 immunoglobulin heavy chain junction region [Macaca mulatta]MOX59119.1 immunoglobulin heavy chain junction region [Macaca mulatta]MOX59133.1 immunoglobulin heavy chain junction region [Macaca mulatta]MOX59266.1 immunoglobulin heavy chain junction region [Macaca mulatta]
CAREKYYSGSYKHNWFDVW